MRKNWETAGGNLPNIMIDVAAISTEDYNAYLAVGGCVNHEEYDFPFVAAGHFNQVLGEIERRAVK